MKELFIALAASATLAAPALAAPATAVARGTDVYATVERTLSSKTSRDGDAFVLDQKDRFFHRNPAALAGAVIDGHVEHVTAAGPTHKATMELVLDDVKFPSGATEPLHATLVSLKAVEPRTHHVRDLGLIVGGAVAGRMLGGRTGVKHGGLAGAGAGFALASTLKSDIVVKPGTVMTLKLDDALDAAGGSQAGAPAASGT